MYALSRTPTVAHYQPLLWLPTCATSTIARPSLIRRVNSHAPANAHPCRNVHSHAPTNAHPCGNVPSHAPTNAHPCRDVHSHTPTNAHPCGNVPSHVPTMLIHAEMCTRTRRPLLVPSRCMDSRTPMCAPHADAWLARADQCSSMPTRALARAGLCSFQPGMLSAACDVGVASAVPSTEDRNHHTTLAVASNHIVSCIQLFR